MMPDDKSKKPDDVNNSLVFSFGIPMFGLTFEEEVPSI